MTHLDVQRHGDEEEDRERPSRPPPSNEYVLNVAFYSFVGFLSIQTIFALIANSQSMLADSEAMSVDALTYLFNLCAERIKNRPYTEIELTMSELDRSYKREMQRLYLEVIPPTISVLTLICVTIVTFREACQTLRTEGSQDAAGEEEDDDVSITIMFMFSAGNLLLDILNVTCFARANMNFGLDIVRREGFSIQESIRETYYGDDDLRLTPSSSEDDSDPYVVNESTSLLSSGSTDISPSRQQRRSKLDKSASGDVEMATEHYDRISSSAMTPSRPHEIVNLNMCSAWTHVCADTLRSTAVLVAAAIAILFPDHVNGEHADAVAAIVVSAIIFLSLIPLVQGLCLTTLQILTLLRRRKESLSKVDDL